MTEKAVYGQTLFSREMGIPMAELGRKLGVGTSAIAMAIRKKEETG